MISLATELAPLPLGWWPKLRPWLWWLCWLAVLGLLAQRTYHAYYEFDTIGDADALKHRPGNNCGHAQIDFGGQWVMGRMLVTGNGQRLYHRQVQWEVVAAGYPADREPPVVAKNRFPLNQKDPKYQGEVIWHDREWMMYWFMGRDSPKWSEVGKAVSLPFLAEGLIANPFSQVALLECSRDQLTPEVLTAICEPAIGGPLYPPVHAFFYAPLGWIDEPETAYRVFQVFSLLLAVIGGIGVSYLSQGRIWASIATFCILLYPGYRSGLDLAQNPALSLTFLLWGLAFAVRGRPILGGLCWGMLAFKPVWAVTFLAMPLLLRQWRFAFSMAGTGAAWILVTLPFVGLHSWFDWLKVGQEATELYNVNETWITLSRDLQGLVRRLMTDFKQPESDRNTPEISQLAWALWGSVFGLTILLTLWRNNRQWLSPVTGFAMLGLYLSCYRFMYYDVLLSAAGVFLLIAASPRQLDTLIFDLRQSGRRISLYLASLPLTILLLLLIEENWFIALGFEVTARFGHLAYTTADTAGNTGLHVPVVQVVANVYYPHDTLLVLLLWAILAVKLLFSRK